MRLFPRLPVPFSRSEEEAWRRIVFRLENETGFWFGLLAGSDRASRKRLRDRTKVWCEERGKPFSLHAVGPAQMRLLAADLSAAPPSCIHWIVADSPESLASEWDAGARSMWMAMNERRDAYRRHVHAGLVVEGQTSLTPILRDFAPDMFSIRAFVLDPRREPAAPIPVLARPSRDSFVAPTMTEAPERLLARLDRLSDEKDPEAQNLAGITLFCALGALLEARRWPDVRRIAARFEAGAWSHSDSSKHAIAASWVRVSATFARAALQPDVSALAEVRGRLTELSAQGGARPPFPSLLLRAAELDTLMALGRWNEVGESVMRAKETITEALRTSPALVPSGLFGPLLGYCARAAGALRAQGKMKEATSAVEAFTLLVERARSTSPEDPFWQPQRAWVNLLLAEDRLVNGNAEEILRLSNEALSLAEAHDDGSEQWAVIRGTAHTIRLIALAQTGAFQEVVNSALQSPNAPAPPETLPASLRSLPAVLHAYALSRLGDPRTPDALDAALQVLVTTMPAWKKEESLSLLGAWLLLSNTLADTLALDAQHRLPSASGFRLRCSEQITGALFAMDPQTTTRDLFLRALDVQAFCAESSRESLLQMTEKKRRKLLRKIRAIRRWHPGSRLPPFVMAYRRAKP